MSTTISSPFLALAKETFPQFLRTKFSEPVPHEKLSAILHLKALHNGPNVHHISITESLSPSFPLSAFLSARGISVDVHEPKMDFTSWKPSPGSVATHPSVASLDNRDTAGQLINRLAVGIITFVYKEVVFQVYKITWTRERMHESLYHFVFEADVDEKALANLKSPGHQLVSDVFEWAAKLKDEIWVFQSGCWSKDKALWKSVQSASWDDIVLDDDFLEGLRRDTQTFFESESFYRELGIVWKRGILLLGPPGNGKTESIKALLRESGQKALYVKSFTTQGGPEEGVRAIFQHARNNAPCILVIEDLDSLVTSDVRSFFLNEIDGLGQNEGILTIATTNHPEQIDDAIINRPSRFDVKYNFDLPSEDLRRRYAVKWIHKTASLNAGMTFGDVEKLAQDIAKETDGWSFAFLKELFVSFLLRVAHDRARSHIKGVETTVDGVTVLKDQIVALSKQIAATAAVKAPSGTTAPQRATFFRMHGMQMGENVAHPGLNF